MVLNHSRSYKPAVTRLGHHRQVELVAPATQRGIQSNGPLHPKQMAMRQCEQT